MDYIVYLHNTRPEKWVDLLYTFSWYRQGRPTFFLPDMGLLIHFVITFCRIRPKNSPGYKSEIGTIIRKINKKEIVILFT